MRYTGSEWIKRNHDVEMSEFGEKIADLLGILARGIYHLDYGCLKKVEWKAERYIEFMLSRWFHLGTFDSPDLTRLVMLAHKFNVKVAIEPCTPTHLKIIFWQVTPTGFIRKRHPTIQESIEMHKECR